MLLRWQVLRWLGMLAVVATFLWVSDKAAMQAVGAVTVADAVAHLRDGRIPYGWAGQAPKGHLTGFPLVLVCLVMGSAGCLMLVRPELMLALLGWDGA